MHLILFRYDSWSNFSASRLSPSIYTFLVFSKFTDLEITGLAVFVEVLLAFNKDSFLPGHVNSYFSFYGGKM